MITKATVAALAALLAQPCLAAVVEREIGFPGVGGFTLNGTLVIPDGASAESPVAAMLLLPGSGPTDRDGNQQPYIITNLLKQTADALAEVGIATLRFDKRATPGYLEEWPQENLDVFFSYENLVGDAAEALDYLRGVEATDPARVGIFGHSAGGLYALQIGADRAGNDNAPAALIIAAAAGRPLDTVVREQIAEQLKRSGADKATTEEYMAALDGAIAKVKAREEINLEALPPGLAGLFNPTAMGILRAYFSIDPTVLASKVRGPVLVLQGEADMQISPELDSVPLEAALKGRKGEGGNATERVVVEGASHNLKATSGANDPGFTGPVAEGAMKAIVEWTTKQLAE